MPRLPAGACRTAILLPSARFPECQYAWGAADALALLGEVLTEQGHPDLAQDALRQAVDLQSALRHPDLARTEALLRKLGS